jgi:hypothetical protein
MNKIIREHYPASKLPNDLREGIDPASNVTVTIVAEENTPRRVPTLEEIWAMRRPPYRTVEDIDAQIREGRKDRDDD